MDEDRHSLDEHLLDEAIDHADHPVTEHDRHVMKKLWKEYIKKKASPAGAEDAKRT